jgi:phenylacetate-CoA ligase
MSNWRRPLLSMGLQVGSPTTARELALLRTIQFDRAAIQRLHEQRLTALLGHAWSTTEYYRQVLTEVGVVRNGVVDLARFEDIPFLTRDILRDQFDRLTSRSLPKGRRAYRNATGGSTGQPAQFLQDNGYWDVNVATKLFHFEWSGKRPGDRELKIWGAEHDLLKGREALSSRLKNWLYNRRSEQCFFLPEDRVQAIIAHINRFRPDLIWAYRDGIDVIAQAINRQGLKVHRPKAVFLGGGTIYPHIVKAVEKAFGAPAINIYGGRETGDVACQCPERRGLHVSLNSHKVEVVDLQGRAVADGQEGELAITSLHNYAMPLIRYRVGDRAAPTSELCACGRPFPMLKAVYGRVIERLVNAQGDSVDPIFFIHIIGVMANEGRVRRFQVVQKAASWLIVNLVLEKDVNRNNIAPELAVITEKVRLVMGSECQIDYHFVDDIPLTTTGKYGYVVQSANA